MSLTITSKQGSSTILTNKQTGDKVVITPYLKNGVIKLKIEAEQNISINYVGNIGQLKERPTNG